MDETNLTLGLGRDQQDAFMRLSPHYYVPSCATPFAVSGNIVLAKPVLSTINNFLTHSE